MNKGLKIGLVVFLILVLLLVGIGIYFYDFYVFKTMRICIGEGVDTELQCEVRQDCVDAFGIDTDSVLEGAPDFLAEKFDEVYGKVLYCEGTCFIRNLRGISPDGNIEKLDYCSRSEEEYLIEIRGKGGLEILKWKKNLE
jgi:hypothetical protein